MGLGQKQVNQLNIKRYIGFLFLIIILAGWIIGYVVRGKSLDQVIASTVSTNEVITSVSNGTYNILNENGILTGYLGIGSSNGYGGPIKVAVISDLKGVITRVVIVDQKETIPFFNKILDKNYPHVLKGRKCWESLKTGTDIDSVSGATISFQGLLRSVQFGSGMIARDIFDIKVVIQNSKNIKFGLPEIVLLVLFGVGFFQNRKNSITLKKTQKYLIWSSRVTGIIALGFIFTIPLSIININSLFMGYFPDWHNSLYWYILLIGVLLPYLLGKTSPYCNNFCPFGAAQEILKLIGGGKHTISFRVHKLLKWMQQGLFIFLVFAALIFRNPAFPNHEVFATFFTLTGTTLQFATMAFVLIVSLFVIRPWCNYLCPIRALTELVRIIRFRSGSNL